MSMLSSQCNELREKAEELRAHGTFTGFGGLTSTDPLMLKSATLMRDAADTIWQLRDDLQRANDAVRDAEHDESRAWDRVRKAEAENDKLRKLVDKLLYGLNHDVTPADALVWTQEVNTMLRELGVNDG